MDEKELRGRICEVGRWMHEKDLVAGTDGNISARLDEERFIFPPRGAALGRMDPDCLVVTDRDGKALDESQRRTGEYRLHLACYQERAEVGAVIHAHAPRCTALSVAGVPLDRPVLPEVVFHLGSIPTVPYATPCSVEGAEAVRELARAHDAILLDRHGTITLGADLEDAYDNLEKLEHLARVVIAAHALGTLKVLPQGEVRKIALQGMEEGLKREAVRLDRGQEYGRHQPGDADWD